MHTDMKRKLKRGIPLLDPVAERVVGMFCRPSTCKYARIGCRWKGPHQALADHEVACVLPGKTGADIMDALEAFDMRQTEEAKLYKTIFGLLSFEKITFNGKLLRC
jgi:hypothetical protein